MNHFTMRSLIAKHQPYWHDRSFIISAMTGFILFVASLFANYGAVKYATIKAGSATTDILLQLLPAINTDIIFSEGALLFVGFVVVLLAFEPKTIPFTLKSIALFIVIRAFFVSMTHIAPYPDHIASDFDAIKYLGSGADLFFSGHTGLPFLMSLLFWDRKPWRWFFLFCSIVAAVSVILGHLHYTIDVFSAFFIAYGIYHISQKFFPKDHRLFKYGLGRGTDI